MATDSLVQDVGAIAPPLGPIPPRANALGQAFGPPLPTPDHVCDMVPRRGFEEDPRGPILIRPCRDYDHEAVGGHGTETCFVERPTEQFSQTLNEWTERVVFGNQTVCLAAPFQTQTKMQWKRSPARDSEKTRIPRRDEPVAESPYPCPMARFMCFLAASKIVKLTCHLVHD